MDARSHLTMEERPESSTLRELVGIFGNLQSFVEFISETATVLYTDSDCSAKILKKGCSSKSKLHRIAVQIYHFCIKHNIQLEVHWVPRRFNQLADYLAGIYDENDWKLSDFWFEFLDVKPSWGKHTIDRFATDKNCLLSKFNSAWFCPGTSGVDCFVQSDWHIENNWCNPPFGLIGRLLHTLREHRAKATIIVPRWTGRHWWPLICPDGVHFASFIVDWVELPRNSWGRPLFLPGAGRANQFAVGPPNFRVYALRVDFS